MFCRVCLQSKVTKINTYLDKIITLLELHYSVQTMKYNTAHITEALCMLCSFTKRMARQLQTLLRCSQISISAQ